MEEEVLVALVRERILEQLTEVAVVVEIEVRVLHQLQMEGLV